MITEAEATRLLKRADPARFDERVRFVDAAGYLAALRTRSTTVTLIDTPPTPTQPNGRHRSLLIAAALVAVGVGALILVTRDDEGPSVPGNTTVPVVTTVAPVATTAQEVVEGFLDAYGAHDADRALSYLTEDVIAADWESAEEFRRFVAWTEAAGYKELINFCEQVGTPTEAGTTVHCSFDLHGFGSDAIGLGPFGPNDWNFTVHDGKIVAQEQSGGEQFSDQVWAEFARWVRIEHPDDVLVMYRDSSQQRSVNTPEGLRLWELRTQGWAQAVLAGHGTYAADVEAICATQAAQLEALAEPTEGTLDQVAAWTAAVAQIVDQAGSELATLDRPQGRDTRAYSMFYNTLLPILNDLAEAAAAGDSARVSELDAEYHEVRQDMTSGPNGSGLEDCLASLPS